MSPSTEKVLAKMQATRDELLALIEGLEGDALAWRSSNGRWSIRENLAHLVDAERAHRRFARAVLDGRSTRLKGFDLDRWNQERVDRRADQSIHQLLDALRAERQETLAFIPSIPHDAWDMQGDHPALGQVSVRQAIRIIGVHEPMKRMLLEAQAE